MIKKEVSPQKVHEILGKWMALRQGSLLEVNKKSKIGWLELGLPEEKSKRGLKLDDLNCLSLDSGQPNP